MIMKAIFDEFWGHATGAPEQHPFDYQRRLATEVWPEIVKIPTGLRKTEGVELGWMYKTLQGDLRNPSRLIWSLPMRSL